MSVTKQQTLYRVTLTPYEALWLAQRRSGIDVRSLAKKCKCSVNLIIDTFKHKKRNKITSLIFSYFKVDRFNPVDMTLNFGEYVMWRLRQAGISIGEFSKACGISRTNLNNYATHGIEPTFRFKTKIIDSLNERN